MRIRAGCLLAWLLVSVLPPVATVRAADRAAEPPTRPADGKALAIGSIGGRTLKGTTFFGGSGMDGGYIDDMVAALEEAGIGNVRAADARRWSTGNEILDALAAPFNNQRDARWSDFSEFGQQGEQFNLIGYSHGALQAAQAAIDYADLGGKVDNLVLLAAPVEEGFLAQLGSHPNIGAVRIIDLADQGDPVRAGMSDARAMMAAWELARQKFLSGTGGEIGHFQYVDQTAIGKQRRRVLARKLREAGLR